MPPAGPARDRPFELFISYSLLRVLVRGGHLIIASNPLLSTATFGALSRAGLDKRGEIIRLDQTLRGGDRPKGPRTSSPRCA